MVYHPRMKPLTRGWEWIDGCTIFISIWIILSIWFGYAGLLSPVVGVVSLILAYGVAQKIPPSVREPPLRTATVAFAIMFVGLAAILFGVQGGFDLSADATPSVATMIIAQGIPATYSPFFDLPVFYQMGLPAVASQFVPLGFPPHIVLWFFAIMGIGIFLAGLLRLGARINPNPLFLFWVPIVFLGTRFPVYNVLLGEYPWLISFGLGMAAVSLFSRSWKAGLLVLTASGLAHPYVGLLFALVWVAFTRPTLQKLFQTAAGGIVLTLPLVVFLILPFSREAHASLSSVEPFSVGSIFANVLLVGLVPVALAAGWAIQKIISREKWSMNEGLLVLLSGGAIILSTIFNAWFPELILGTKLPVLAIIGTTLLGALFLSRIIKPHHSFRVAAGIIIVSFVLLATSPSMQSYAIGSKSTLDEGAFAQFLREYDSRVVPVLFLSEGGGKMAQYSWKIPTDPKGAHFMLALQLLDTPLARALKQQSQDYHELYSSQCVSCVDDFLKKYPSTYVVVNSDEFPLLNRTPSYHAGKFFLYVNE